MEFSWGLVQFAKKLFWTTEELGLNTPSISKRNTRQIFLLIQLHNINATRSALRLQYTPTTCASARQSTTTYPRAFAFAFSKLHLKILILILFKTCKRADSGSPVDVVLYVNIRNIFVR